MSVAAGGWAVITLDALPSEIHAGETLEIGFMVRQHGNRPMEGLAPQVNASHIDSDATVRVVAQAQGETGHYIAELTLPQAGRWDWSIRAFTMDQPMPPLMVRTISDEVAPATTFQYTPFWLGGLALSAVAGAVLLARKRLRWAAVGLILAFLFTASGFVLAASQAPEKSNPIPMAASLAEQGAALFLAKGCITCHRHATIAAQYNVESGFSGPAGSAPDLTDYVTSPEFLQVWLAHPQQVKPDTEMPNLGLTDAEIRALSAFLIMEPAAVPVTEGPPKNCPVTQPPDPAFLPPDPSLTQVSGPHHFWYGTVDLWTMLPVVGVWRGLPYHQAEGGHYSNKVFWWHVGYDWQTEPEPEFTVTARRLDNVAPHYESTAATNAYTPDFGSAILTGVEIPTPGCWEFTGQYQDHSLSFVVWVAP